MRLNAKYVDTDISWSGMQCTVLFYWFVLPPLWLSWVAVPSVNLIICLLILALFSGQNNCFISMKIVRGEHPSYVPKRCSRAAIAWEKGRRHFESDFRDLIYQTIWFNGQSLMVFGISMSWVHKLYFFMYL